MSETVLWLGYLLGAGAAFAAVYLQRWRLVPAILGGTAVSLVVWVLTVLATSIDDRTPWLQVDLAINASLGMIFAGAGAALAYALGAARVRKDRSPQEDDPA